MTTKEKASTVHQKYASDKTKEASQNHNLDLILKAQALDKIYQGKGTNFTINHKITPRHMYRLETKESLRDWSMHCSPSKVLQLCSFRIVQKRQREVILQAFFSLLAHKALVPTHQQILLQIWENPQNSPPFPNLYRLTSIINSPL